jgi:DNA adenine methylase
MKVPHPIPYQGSKRNLAASILRFFPSYVETLHEPFAGSAALTLAAAGRGLARRFVLNDLNAPLMALWREIINQPHRIASQYEELWQAQAGREREFYDHIRANFNDTGKPEYLLYLLARCVKAAVRYNANGEFNQSPDNRRKGMRPDNLRQHINSASLLLRGKAELTAQDYRTTLQGITPRDLVYLDPPYEGVKGRRDPRYLQQVSRVDLIAALDDMNARNISYLLSYDGRTGDKRFGEGLPSFLELQRVELLAGRSSQATLLGRSVMTYESLYISPALQMRLGVARYQEAA